MKRNTFYAIALAALFLWSCKTDKKTGTDDTAEIKNGFEYVVDQFADLRILRYQIPGWEDLTLKEQKLVYYLTQAGLSGRDIMWDQNYRHNLRIRKALENIYTAYKGDKTTGDWKNFEVYLKRIWFSNGIHHHYSNDKIKPDFSREYFETLLNETATSLAPEAVAVIFDESDAKKVNQAKSVDNVALSAVNFYGPDITNEDVMAFYAGMESPDPEKPLSFGLNSQLVKENGTLKERVYKSGGLYGEAIDKIIYWLEKAREVAENQAQGDALGLLIEYYRTGDLKTWDDYNVAWTQATEGNIDYINGFVEVYNDPLGYRGSYETIVQIKDFEMSRKMAVLSENAQWFEDHSPLMK
ncbi:MAG: dihydrofolate reductase, partial [Sinomicrobium sp.]|nr:dihydrofolate reductase [Sinomicrobium sp.]